MAKLLDLLVNEKCQSYEDFLDQLINLEPVHQDVIQVIQKLEIFTQNKEKENDKCTFSCGIKRTIVTNEADQEVQNIIKTIKVMSEETGGIYFLSNICWFYRWLLSEGYPYIYEDDCIEMVRKFIAAISIPGYVSREIKWTLVFGNYATFSNEDKKAVFEDIMERVAPAGEMKTFSDIIDCWLIHHIILRTVQDKSKMDLYLEKILMNYISLVDTYPELEEVFGVAIEKDMEMVYKDIQKAREGTGSSKHEEEKRVY